MVGTFHGAVVAIVMPSEAVQEGHADTTGRARAPVATEVPPALVVGAAEADSVDVVAVVDGAGDLCRYE